MNAARLAALALLALAAAPLSCTRPADAPTATSADAETQAKIRAALAGAHRTDKERARDVYRHPLETLSFFGLRDDMTVIEIAPGGGWYTAVLAPVLAEKGHFIAITPDVNGDPKGYGTKIAAGYLDLLSAHPDVYGKVGIVVFDEKRISFGPDGSADLVLTFRNVHNWIEDGMAAPVFAAAFRVLKPGGKLGVVEHRGRAGMDVEAIKKSGYVPVDVVVGLAEQAGFTLAAESEVNANPKDTKDYAEGVWTLPPTYALGDKDHDKYAAIGESDRMTLEFQKPAQ